MGETKRGYRNSTRKKTNKDAHGVLKPLRVEIDEEMEAGLDVDERFVVLDGGGRDAGRVSANRRQVAPHVAEGRKHFAAGLRGRHVDRPAALAAQKAVDFHQLGAAPVSDAIRYICSSDAFLAVNTRRVIHRVRNNKRMIGFQSVVTASKKLEINSKEKTNHPPSRVWHLSFKNDLSQFQVQVMSRRVDLGQQK